MTPINKRWPDKYTFKAKVYVPSPSTSRMEMETFAADEEVGVALLYLLTVCHVEKEKSPELVQWCKDFNDKFIRAKEKPVLLKLADAVEDNKE